MTDSERPGIDPLEHAASGHRQVHLLGFMGAGKSTIARLLARRLVWNYLDIDALVSRHAEMSIPEIFARDGEAAFRDHEHHALRMAVQKPRTVVALGGGAPLRDDSWRLISESAFSVWLQVSFATCAARVGQTGTRPLFADVEGAERIFAERQSAYARADLAIDAEGEADAVAAAIEVVVRGG